MAIKHNIFAAELIKFLEVLSRDHPELLLCHACSVLQFLAGFTERLSVQRSF